MGGADRRESGWEGQAILVVLGLRSGPPLYRRFRRRRTARLPRCSWRVDGRRGVDGVAGWFPRGDDERRVRGKRAVCAVVASWQAPPLPGWNRRGVRRARRYSPTVDGYTSRTVVSSAPALLRSFVRMTASSPGTSLGGGRSTERAEQPDARPKLDMVDLNKGCDRLLLNPTLGGLNQHPSALSTPYRAGNARRQPYRSPARGARANPGAPPPLGAPAIEVGADPELGTRVRDRGEPPPAGTAAEGLDPAQPRPGPRYSAPPGGGRRCSTPNGCRRSRLERRCSPTSARPFCECRTT